MNHLTLHPGPRLCRQLRHDAGESSAWAEEDVTEKAAEYLFAPVEFAPGLALSDVFALVEAAPVLKTVYRQSFIVELCAEASKGISPQYTPGYAAEGLEFLDLYQVWSVDSREKSYEDSGHWNFHGVGYELRAEDQPGQVMNQGRIHWDVSCAGVRNLLALPVRIQRQAPVCENDTDSAANGQALFTATVPLPTLGQALQAMFWSLSFYGVQPGDTSVAESAPVDVADVQLNGGASTEDTSADRMDAFDRDAMFGGWFAAGVLATFEELGPPQTGRGVPSPPPS